MYSGFVENISQQQTRGHEHADIYIILINFSSFGLNLLYDESALKSESRVTRKNYRKRLETGIKDESDESLRNTTNFSSGRFRVNNDKYPPKMNIKTKA